MSSRLGRRREGRVPPSTSLRNSLTKPSRSPTSTTSRLTTNSSRTPSYFQLAHSAADRLAHLLAARHRFRGDSSYQLRPNPARESLTEAMPCRSR
jgi:hypothetical protein